MVLSLFSADCLAVNAGVVLGDEQFDAYLPLLEGKRVALFSNHTGIVGDETSCDGAVDVDCHFGLDAEGVPIQYASTYWMRSSKGM